MSKKVMTVYQDEHNQWCVDIRWFREEDPAPYQEHTIVGLESEFEAMWAGSQFEL